jgi:hypothetical protein
MYEPESARLVMVKSRISAAAWEARVEAARADEVVLKAIAELVKGGLSLNAAIKKEVPNARRSWVVHRWPKFQAEGLEALIDARVAREPKVAKESGPLIEAAREANPAVTADEMTKILARQGVSVLPSLSTIKRSFARVDRRQEYTREKERAKEEIIELPFAGGELLLAAEEESGLIAALTSEVEALGEEAKEASEGQVPEQDTAHRSAKGQFTITYNRKRKRKAGQEVASYLRTAAEKAEGRVRSWPHFMHESREAVESKLWMLALSPLVAGTKGWDALRAQEVAGLEPLTGYAYMPSTLSKLTSALAISGAGPRLLETVGTHWHRVAEERWEEPGAMAALYIDNHVKEVWSSLFTQSGKVSRLNRVMPAITETYIQTGAGTPLVASVQSGGAPLAPRFMELVKNAEAKLDGGVVRRAVIIDSEGSTFDILAACAAEERVIVTPLKPSRMPSLKLKYSRGSYYRPYREHDELRVGSGTLTHKSSGRSLEVGVLHVRRTHRDRATVLLTTGLALGMSGTDLADLYFARWPIQENSFKEGAAVGLGQHRGNCGRMVVNVAVVTELERLEARAKATTAERTDLAQAAAGLESAHLAAQGEHQRAASALATRRRRLDALVDAGHCDGKQLGTAAIEHQTALLRSEETAGDLATALAAMTKSDKRTADLDSSLAEGAARAEKLQHQRSIRQLDVALDMVLTATKLACSLLISFALREYLVGTSMTPQTFATRFFGFRGRREVRPEEEHVFFYENPRDPEANATLADACRRLNLRRLSRDGRSLRYEMAAHDGSRFK